MLTLTAELLSSIPEFSTLWNIRRELIEDWAANRSYVWLVCSQPWKRRDYRWHPIHPCICLFTHLSWPAPNSRTTSSRKLKVVSKVTCFKNSSQIRFQIKRSKFPLPPLGHIWDVMLVWRNVCIEKNCLCVTVLCTIIMVHKDTSSSYRSVNSIRPWSCMVYLSIFWAPLCLWSSWCYIYIFFFAYILLFTF